MSSYPIGWYRVGAGTDLVFGEVLAVKAFGMKLAAFRDTTGTAHLVDAYCAHLGADLTVGGTVVGDTVVCPFHCWAYDGAGRCVRTQAPGRISSRARVRSFPTREVNGSLVAFWHPRDAEPPWELPPAADCEVSDAWTPWDRRSWVVKTHVQEVFENGPDSVHQRTLHCAVEDPESTFQLDGHIFRGTLAALYEAGAGLPEVIAHQRSTYTNYGMGFTKLSMDLDYDGLRLQREILFWVTPLEEETVRATLETRGLRTGDAAFDDLTHREITRHTWRSFEEDIPIWENKVYRPSPGHGASDVAAAVLTDADDGVIELRRWARQFYDTGGATPARSEHRPGDAAVPPIGSMPT